MAKINKKQTTMTDIILFIACTLCGYAVGKYFEKRILQKGKFYQDLQRYIALLKENIDGRQVELDKFNKEFCSNSSPIFATYLNEGKLKCRLTANQKSNLAAFFDNLNCISSQQLNSHLDYYYKVLSDECSAVVANEVARASVYSKLGMLLGAMLGIVLM